MRISDGSSDVCSSDLPSAVSAAAHYDAASEALDTDFLGPDRGAAMVFYSHGSTGWKRYHAARQAAEAGYNNVMWMRGGYADWARSEEHTSELQSLMRITYAVFCWKKKNKQNITK